MANLSNINNKFLVTTGGNVLIGQTSAVGSSIFQVTGNSTFAGSVTVENDNDSVILIESVGTDATDDARLELKTTNGTFTIQNDRSIGTSGALTFAGNTSNNLVIDHDLGNIGIGTTVMNTTLNLYSASNTQLGFQDASTGTGSADGFRIGYNGTYGQLWLFENADFRIATNNTERLRIDSSGNVNIYGTDNRPLAITSFNTVSTGAGWDLDATSSNGVITMSTGGEERMRIQSDGNVGIGTNSPDSPLHLSQAAANTFFKMEAYASTQGADAGINVAREQVTGSESNLSFWTNTGSALTQKMAIDSSGTVIIQNNSTTTYGPTLRTVALTKSLWDVGDIVGEIDFYTSDLSGNAPYSAGFIQCQNTTGSGTLPSGALVFGTATYNAVGGAIERMRIDSSGNVGIGTDSPQGKLNVTIGAGTNGAELQRWHYSTTPDRWNLRLTQVVSGNDVAWDFKQTNNNTDYGSVLTLKNGNVGIGTSDIEETLTIAKTDGGDGTIVGLRSDASFSQFEIATKNSQIDWGLQTIGARNMYFTTNGSERMRIDSAGFTTITHSGAGASLTLGQSGGISINENVGFLNFYSNDPSTNSSGGVGGIGVYGETAFGGNTPSYMSFFTHDTSPNDGTVLGNVTERMRITSGGNILFGTQGLPNGTSIYGSAFYKSTVDRMILRMATSITGAAGLIDFFNPNGQVGYIATNGTATQYVTSSDYRLKEDLQDFNGLDKVSKIPVYDFKWKTDESRSYGVMAHELQEVLPDAVSGEKDAEEMQGVDYSKIVPLLVKSIQELKAEIELLKSK